MAGGGPFTGGLLKLLEAVSDRASKANCFEFDIDRSNKTIGIRLLSGNKAIKVVNTVSSSYSVNGQIAHYKDEYKTRSNVNLCVIDPSQLRGTSVKDILESL